MRTPKEDRILEAQRASLAVFEKMSTDTQPYTISALGKELVILPGVFSPKYFVDAIWFAEELPGLVGDRSFLEIGTGCGLESFFVALHNPDNTNIVATDINPTAVENARLNFSSHGLNVRVIEGDLFDPLCDNQKFDVIFWNHPFHYAEHEPEGLLLRAGFDWQYKGIARFFKEAGRYLCPGGEILLGTGSVARIDLIKQLAEKNGYVTTLLRERVVPFDSDNSHEAMRDYIYSFKKP